jgi:hypothetical protein
VYAFWKASKYLRLDGVKVEQHQKRVAIVAHLICESFDLILFNKRCACSTLLCVLSDVDSFDFPFSFENFSSVACKNETMINTAVREFYRHLLQAQKFYRG